MPEDAVPVGDGPGDRGPVVVRGGTVVPVSLDDVMLHDAAWRWSVSLGEGLENELAEVGSIQLPAHLRGWRVAWEARRAATGIVARTMVPVPGHELDAWVVGVHVDDAALVVDVEAGNGDGRHLAKIGPVRVADRWMLNPAVAWVAGEGTRLLTSSDDVTPLWADLADAATAERRLAAAGPTSPAPRVGDVVCVSRWPVTPLVPIGQR